MGTIYLLSYSGYYGPDAVTGIIAAFDNEEEAIRAKDNEESREMKEYSARIAEGHTPTRIFYHVKPIDFITKRKFPTGPGPGAPPGRSE